MHTFFIVANQVMTMMIFLSIGFLFFKKKLMTQEGVRTLSNIIVRFATPCAMMKSFMVDFSTDKLAQLSVSFLFCGIAAILSIALAHFFCRSSTVIDRFCASYGNAGSMGIPLVQAVLGEAAIFDLSAYLLWANILVWTYGFFIVSGKKEKPNVRQLAHNPMVIAAIISLVLFFLPLQLPDVLVGAINGGANILMPLAMFVLGSYLAQTPLLDLFTDMRLYRTTLVRLVLIPIAITLLLLLLPKSYHTISMVIVIASAAPVANNTPIVAEMAHQNPLYATQLVCHSTLFSLLTFPAIVSLSAFLLHTL